MRTVILARPTVSEILLRQMLGWRRAGRRSAGPRRPTWSRWLDELGGVSGRWQDPFELVPDLVVPGVEAPTTRGGRTRTVVAPGGPGSGRWRGSPGEPTPCHPTDVAESRSPALVRARRRRAGLLGPAGRHLRATRGRCWEAAVAHLEGARGGELAVLDAGATWPPASSRRASDPQPPGHGPGRRLLDHFRGRGRPPRRPTAWRTGWPATPGPCATDPRGGPGRAGAGGAAGARYGPLARSIYPKLARFRRGRRRRPVPDPAPREVRPQADRYEPVYGTAGGSPAYRMIRGGPGDSRTPASPDLGAAPGDTTWAPRSNLCTATSPRAPALAAPYGRRRTTGTSSSSPGPRPPCGSGSASSVALLPPRERLASGVLREARPRSA